MNKSANRHMKTSYKFKFYSKGKHFKEKKLSGKIFTQISFLLLVCILTGSVAYLIKKNSITNEFVMGEVKSEIVETFNKNEKTKKDVSIKNSGNVSIYVRTAIVICWKDENGKIIENVPEENVDYSIKFSDSPNWIKSGDGYYYYKNPIGVNSNTDILIEECKQIKEYEDRTLEVSIANQAIQAEPSKAVEEAWGVDIIDNMLNLKE